MRIEIDAILSFLFGDLTSHCMWRSTNMCSSWVFVMVVALAFLIIGDFCVKSKVF